MSERHFVELDTGSEEFLRVIFGNRTGGWVRADDERDVQMSGRVIFTQGGPVCKN